MTPHLTDDAALDAALESGSASARSHAQGCAACAGRVDELRGALELARTAEVPEPSPFYWQQLRSGVSRRIAGEPGPRRVAFLLPLAVVAGLGAVALSLVLPRTPEPPPAAPLAAWSALPAEDEDDGLRVLEGLALASGGSSEWPETFGLAGYLAGMSDDESVALAEGLRLQRQGGES